MSIHRIHSLELFKSDSAIGVCTDWFFSRPVTTHEKREKGIIGEWTMEMIMRSKKSVRSSDIDFNFWLLWIGKKVFSLLYNNIIRCELALCLIPSAHQLKVPQLWHQDQTSFSRSAGNHKFITESTEDRLQVECCGCDLMHDIIAHYNFLTTLKAVGCCI